MNQTVEYHTDEYHDGASVTTTEHWVWKVFCFCPVAVGLSTKFGQMNWNTTPKVIINIKKVTLLFI